MKPRPSPKQARAAALLEVKIEATTAGTFFPIEWPK
jgi:hypothetical protein